MAVRRDGRYDAQSSGAAGAPVDERLVLAQRLDAARDRLRASIPIPTDEDFDVRTPGARAEPAANAEQATGAGPS